MGGESGAGGGLSVFSLSLFFRNVLNSIFIHETGLSDLCVMAASGGLGWGPVSFTSCDAGAGDWASLSLSLIYQIGTTMTESWPSRAALKVNGESAHYTPAVARGPVDRESEAEGNCCY